MQGTQINKHQTHRVENPIQESTRSEDQQRKHDPYVTMVGPLAPVVRYFVTKCQLWWSPSITTWKTALKLLHNALTHCSVIQIRLVEYYQVEDRTNNGDLFIHVSMLTLQNFKESISFKSN